MPPKSKRTVKDESDEEEIKPEPDVEDGDAVQEEAVKKDETVDELANDPVQFREEEEPPAKKRKANLDPEEEVETHVNDQGERYIELSNKRRATVREFKGSTLIDLREYYTDKSGDDKPGAKGLSLTADQWQTLKNAIPQIDAWVAAQGSSSKKSNANGGGSKRGRGRGKGRS
ncbi:hypothetical protein NCC49_005766 [Naganishia albida]|nr:hypothetical protein NCC49_005766 [Naganishia albida]